MKTIYFIIPPVIAITAVLLINASAGVANIQGKDRSGSPMSENGCNMCHSGGTFNAFTTVAVTDITGDTVINYEPGGSYFVSVLISAQGASKFGYQLTAMLDDTTKAGLLDALSPGTAVVQLNGFEYSEHTGAGIAGLFVTQWVAPPAGKGGVTFYAAGLAANGNGSTSGDDFGGFAKVTLGESGGVGIHEMDAFSESLNIYPNPAADFITIRAGANIDNVRIYSLNGSLVYEKRGTQNREEIDMSEMESGTYFIEVLSGNNRGHQRLVKL